MPGTMTERLYSPRILSLITTFRCPARCNHCSFSCSPEERVEMELEKIGTLIAQCQDFNKITLSGGEAFLNVPLIAGIISQASQQGNFKIRGVVTNCFWASSETKAGEVLESLSGAGLNLIGISCDAFHQAYIPLAQVINAIKAALSLRITVQVNVISPHDLFQSAALPEVVLALMKAVGEGRPTREYDLAYAQGYKGRDKGITIFHGEVTPAGRASGLPAEYMGSYDLTGDWKDACILQKKGATISQEGQVLTVLPDYRAFPCCSLYAREGHLSLGNIAEEPLSALVEKAQSDPFLKAVAQIGILGLKEIIEKHFPRYRGKRYGSACHFCHTISLDKELEGLFSP
ncbi:MAG: radical SAM protein [Candidatus Eremiobacteraeota bacterium]|nr:radical SAM protein [Candidatus Eremiobacteraeota bacterium]